MSKSVAFTILIPLAIGLAGCATFDGSQTVKNAQAYYGNAKTYTTTRVGSYLIVEQTGDGQTRKFVTNAVPMSEEEFTAIVKQTKLPGYYQRSRGTFDNMLGTMWQKSFGFIADPSAQGMAEGASAIPPTRQKP